jgi:hypothetical protein
MTGVREYITHLAEIGNLEVVLGDDPVVEAIGSGTMSFQRESQPPMLVRDVLYVPGLKKNLISVSTIEDGGYELVFRDGHFGQQIQYHFDQSDWDLS